MTTYDWREFIRTAVDYSARADQHRPNDRETLRREVMRLHRDGLHPRDIATSLRLDHAEVASMLYGTDEPGEGGV